MPLNTHIPRQPGAADFLDAVHKSFEDARRNMHLARKAVGAAEWQTKEGTAARNAAYATYTSLYTLAKKGELSASLFKDLNDAEDALQEAETCLDSSKAKKEESEKSYAAKIAIFEQARINCEGCRCPESHQTNPDSHHRSDPFSKEANQARKRAREHQQRANREKNEVEEGGRTYRDYARGNPFTSQDEEPKPFKNPFANQYGSTSADGQSSGPPGSDKPGSSKPGNSQHKGSQEHKNTFTGTSPTARPQPKAAEWLAAAHEAFQDRASMATFPQPPVGRRCRKQAHKNEAENRALAACACGVRQALEGLSSGKLKALRLSFHPDKFSRCRTDLVQHFKRQAAEVFVVVEEMYREKK